MCNQGNLPGEDYLSLILPGSYPETAYPDITVKLTGLDGNIGGVMGRTRDALTQAGVEETPQVMSALWAEVMDADSYPEALQAVMRVVNTE